MSNGCCFVYGANKGEVKETLMTIPNVAAGKGNRSSRRRCSGGRGSLVCCCGICRLGTREVANLFLGRTDELQPPIVKSRSLDSQFTFLADLTYSESRRESYVMSLGAYHDVGSWVVKTPAIS